MRKLLRFYFRSTKHIYFFSDIYIKDYAEILCPYAAIRDGYAILRGETDALS